MADNLNGKKHKYFGSLGLTGQLSEREKKWRLLVGIGLGTIALFTYLKTQLGYTKNVNTMMHDYIGGVEPFSLSSYKLQIPRNSSGGTTGDAYTVSQPELDTYGPNAWFDRGTSFTFTVASTDPTLGSNVYPRGELRHITDRAWDVAARTKVVATVKALPDNERVIISQALDGGGSTSGVYKIEVTGGPPNTSEGLLRIKYKGTQGGTETTVVLRSDMAVDANGEMEQIAISVARYPDRLDVFYGNNVDGGTPDWSSADLGEVAFTRDASSGLWVTKMGNYLQSNSLSPVVTSVVSLDAGTLAEPTIINTSAVWILETGAWDDSGTWDDSNVWKDA